MFARVVICTPPTEAAVGRPIIRVITDLYHSRAESATPSQSPDDGDQLGLPPHTLGAQGRCPDGTPRTCPNCSRPVQIVNQRKQPNQWDKNPLKVVCPKDEGCVKGYYVALDERAPFTEWPRCQKDGRTKYRCVRRGRGKVWQCPKHPKQCPTYKVVPGDPT
ncbi:MAG: hypothetical protein JSU86_06385 [Phycisphaerales bacterium]|nr:MAG: hypothetical protein JSU86_06385 [Phycisphaerales bacterium]